MAASGTKNQGIKVYIGTTATDPSGDTFEQVKRVKGIDRVGAEAATIDATALEDAAKAKLKGIPDFGAMMISGLRVYTDAGQNAAKAAAADTDDEPYNMRIEVPGAAAGGDDVRYEFKAIVTKFEDKPGDVDGLVGYEFGIAVTGAVTQSAV